MTKREIRAVIAQIGIISRIVLQPLRPAFFHIAQLTLGARQLFWRDIFAAGDRLVVLQLGKGRPDDTPASLADPQTVIHIVKGHRQVNFI